MRFVLRALLVVSAGCSGHTGRIAATAPALNVPYAERAGTSLAPAGRPPADDAARVLGLPTLNAALVPEGTREIRMSDWYSMIAGTPVLILRLVEQQGHPAVGQWIWVWPEHRDWPRRYRASQCSAWADDTRRCAFATTRTPLEWPAIAAEFERLGAWSLSERCETDGMHMTDSGALFIQRLAGAEFSAYGCNTPSRRTDSVAGRTALAIYRYFGTLGRQAGGPPPA
jgi:hypothetical protein